MSVLMEISNSESIITGLSIEQHKKLKGLISYTVPGFFYTGVVQRRYLLSARGAFPTGLLYIVEKYLKKDLIYHTLKDLRIKPNALESIFKMSLGYPPYPEQLDAAKTCLRSPRGIIAAPTGVGKSIIAVLIINELQVPTLIVVPTLELKKQLTKTMEDAFGRQNVGEGKNICVKNVDSCSLKATERYDCVIIDEFHHSGASTYRKLNKKAWNNIYYRYGLTATPFRSQSEEKLLLESVLSETIYKIDYKTAVESGYIVPLEAYYIHLPALMGKIASTNYAEAYKKMIVENEDRNKVIADLLGSLNSQGASVLCLVKEIQHGVNLQALADFDCTFVKGENDDNRIKLLEFIIRERNCLIGTTGVLGEGVDTKPCEYVIIASPMKSKNLFMQCVGRAFRKYPGKETAKIILLKDCTHKWFASAFREQCKILLEEYNVKPIKLNV